MTVTTDAAIEKITKEAMAINEPLAQAIEEYLTNKCTNTTVASKLLDESKSVRQIVDKIWAEAKKRRKGNCAFIPPAEVYAMIDEYYGLDVAPHGETPRQAPAANKVNVLDLF